MRSLSNHRFTLRQEASQDLTIVPSGAPEKLSCGSDIATEHVKRLLSLILMPPHHFLLAIFSLLLLSCSSKAAEWSKLKTCSDLGFGRRHRFFTPQEGMVYKLAADSLALTTWRGHSALTGSINASDRSPLILVVVAFGNGIFRIVIDDAVPAKHERYAVKDIIMPHVQPLTLESKHIVKGKDKAELVVEGLPSKLVLFYDTFRTDIVRMKDDLVLGSFNPESRLLVESFQEKPVPSPSASPSPSSNTPIDYEEHSRAKEELDKVGDVDDEELERCDECDMDDEAEYNHAISSDEAGPENEAKDEGFDSSTDTCDGCWEERYKTHTDSKPRGPESIGVDVSFPFADHIYGLPERTTQFSLIDTIGADNNPLSEPYRLYNLDVFEFELDKPLGLYGAIPFLIARHGENSAGFLWLNAAETYVDVARRNEGKYTHWFAESGMIDAYFLPGPNASSVFEQYIWLTGAPAMPQRFSLGYHQCRWNYRDEDDSKAVDANFDELDLPYDVLWLDIEHTDGKRYFTWNYERFPDPTGLQNHIASRGRKMVTIIDPHMKRDNKFQIHRMAQEQNLYVMKPDGKPFDGWCWPGSSSYFDFTSPRVREVWSSLFDPKHYPHYSRNLYTWTDMNEPSVFNGPEGTMQKDLIHDGNVEHRHVHNIYGHYVMQATYEGVLKGHGGDDRPFVLSRSFFAGSQKYGAIWTGDNTATWEHLESSVPMLLSLQVSGMTFSGADVGGFFGNPSANLLTRWYQAAAFQPFFRGHSHLDTNRREPWVFGEPYTSYISNSIRTRYSFLPFWYTLFAGHTLGTGYGFKQSAMGPPMRPLWWHFPNDTAANSNQRQWMVGDALLVAPVLEDDVTSHRLYIPHGETWYDLYYPNANGKRVTGSGDVEQDVALDRMIVFQRGGTIVPKQERRRRSTAAMAYDPFTLLVALNAVEEAEGELYLDDGKSYQYRSGAYAVRRFTFSNGELSAQTVSGGATAFEGSEAEIERVIILGYQGDSPKKVVTDSRVINFVHSKASGALTLQNPKVKAAYGTWKITIQ